MENNVEEKLREKSTNINTRMQNDDQYDDYVPGCQNLCHFIVLLSKPVR